MKRILVANRGEIAVRLSRLHDLGLEAVAVYADDDAGAVRQLADGPSPCMG